MIYRSFIPREVIAQLDRLQRELQHPAERSPSIRGGAPGSFPAINLSSSPTAIEICVFAPGIAPESLDVQIERGVLTVSGERASALPASDAQSTVHIGERFAGRFRRVVTLPDDIDGAAVAARYRNGVLHVSVPRRAAESPRKIEIN
ncbi:Hsp20/alpha crystallin family protein [Niveibacterium sp. 24ML]|uniref:Hsp20/alpha crystallin family protein n=1 Tax=Niveibacterium sp. 24ML TaxID=2985512 RepID=UPI0022722183|nr:Hsp20/alpha crystallin family protein [Niveibacterium sp. 24ML]MCX9157359.1 Hsp20/alpha crystallin family protein [Niveibacterium sp. 24ML]